MLNDHEIWQVGRATSATPLYFEAMRLEEQGEMLDYIDFGYENPSYEAYKSAQQVSHYDHLTVRVLVSIGTGQKVKAEPSSSSAYKRYGQYLDRTVKWTSQSEDTHHTLLHATENYVKYSRLNVGLGTMPFDEWKGDETLKLIRTKTEEYLKSPDGKRQIAESARQLVEVRRQRSTWEPDLDRWERFCHGVQYACPVSTCSDGAKRYKARQNLRDHLKEIHSMEPDELEPLLDEGKRFPLDEVLE